MAREPAAFALRTTAEPECLTKIHDLIVEVFSATAADESVRIRLETAMAEIAANIVEHAAPQPASEISIAVNVHPDRIEAEFRDDGAPADIDLSTPSMPDEFAESGRGLPLAAMLLDAFDYQRIDGYNIWSLSVSWSG